MAATMASTAVGGADGSRAAVTHRWGMTRNASEGCTRSPGKTTSVVRRGRVAPPRSGGATRPRRSTQTCTRAASGEEAGMIESMGQFIGVGLGVVGLSFIAGAQSNGGSDDPSPNTKAASTASRLPPATTNPRCPSRPSRAASRAPATGKTVPRHAQARGGRGGSGSAGAQSSSSSSSKRRNWEERRHPEHRRRQHDEGAHGRHLVPAVSRSTRTSGARGGAGPREYMEDAWAVRDSGFPGGYFRSVMDGHGGEASSAWLRENLFKSLAASCEGASRGRATGPVRWCRTAPRADTSPKR